MGFFEQIGSWLNDNVIKPVGNYFHQNLIKPIQTHGILKGIGTFGHKLSSDIGSLAGKVSDVARAVSSTGIPVVSQAAATVGGIADTVKLGANSVGGALRNLT